MKAFALKLFSWVAKALLALVLAATLVRFYIGWEHDDTYDVTYLPEIDATCIKSMYLGKVAMTCMDGRRIEVKP